MQVPFRPWQTRRTLWNVGLQNPCSCNDVRTSVSLFAEPRSFRPDFLGHVILLLGHLLAHIRIGFFHMVLRYSPLSPGTLLSIDASHEPNTKGEAKLQFSWSGYSIGFPLETSWISMMACGRITCLCLPPDQRCSQYSRKLNYS